MNVPPLILPIVSLQPNNRHVYRVTAFIWTVDNEPRLCELAGRPEGRSVDCV
jgi:hypothetical protein